MAFGFIGLAARLAAITAAMIMNLLLREMIAIAIVSGANRIVVCQSIRDALVSAYRANPRIYLSITAARRLCAVNPTHSLTQSLPSAAPKPAAMRA